MRRRGNRERGAAPATPAAGSRPGVSLLEILLGAMIIGLSALPVLELIRSSTASLDVTGSEVAARTLAGDLLERYSRPPIYLDRDLGQVTRMMLGAPIPWRQLIQDDPHLARGFPDDRLAPLLDRSDVRLTLDVRSPYSHPALGPSTGMDCILVTASWKDRQDHRKKVTLGRLVDHR